MTIYVTHKHHIIPKHMGGTDDNSNIVHLSIEEHAEAHRILYEQHGCWQDKIAWQGLSGMIEKAEIIHEIQRKNGQRMGELNKGRSAWNKGLTLDDPRVQKYHRKDYKIKNTEKMGRYVRTDECLEKLRAPKTDQHKEKLRIAAELQFSDPEFKLKFSAKLRSIRDKCQYCGMESNKSNIARHKKICKSRT